MMNKKYFFFDIDGTLTDDATHKIVPSALKTLRLLEENGHFVSIATGRAHYKTINFANDIDIHNLVCLGGGCLVVEDQIVDFQYLPHEKVLELLDYAERDHVGALIMLDDSDKVYLKNDLFLRQAGLRRELTTYIMQPDLNVSDHEIVKVYLSYRKEQEKDLPWIDMLGRLRLHQEYCVVQYDAKDQGILRMMKHLNAPIEDVVVFGNDTNDLVMFRKEWTSIAMGNSPDVLKEKADYVTEANVDDGIYKACRKFGWIRE